MGRNEFLNLLFINILNMFWRVIFRKFLDMLLGLWIELTIYFYKFVIFEMKFLSFNIKNNKP